MKKLLFSLLALLLIFTACAEKTSDNGDGGSKDENCDNGTVYMITDTGGIDDKSFNQGTWEGIEKLAEDETNVCTESIISEKEADYETNLSAAVDKNPDIIVAAGYKFGDAMRDVALSYPDQKFLLIDMVVEDKDGNLVENVANAVFAEHEGSYLAGVAAGMKTKEDGKNKVGFIGGEESPLIKKFGAGFEAGVKSVDESIEVAVSYTGSFTESAKGKIEAQKMYNDGAYIIYQAAGNSGNGVIQEAQERYEDGEEVWVIGVDRDQYEDGMVNSDDHSVILTSMVKKVDTASYDISKLTLDGEFPGGEIIVFDLSNDGVGIPEENPNLNDEITNAVTEAREKILAGEIEVPETFE